MYQGKTHSSTALFDPGILKSRNNTIPTKEFCKKQILYYIAREMGSTQSMTT